MEWEKLTEAQEGERLSLKGFLFQAKDGRWILANKPDLKNCCIGSVHEQKTQVALQGDFSRYSAQVPLQVRGIFHMATTGAYALSDTEVIQKGGFPIWTAGALVICLMAFGFRLKRLLLP
jgi:hypothetical protein